MPDYQKTERVFVFCDAHHFSSLMVELADEQPAFIQAFYERVGDAVVNRRGTLIKYIGDAILSVFPKGTEAEAVECGIEMRRQYAALIEEFGAKTESDLEIGIGAGEVYFGTFGHPSLRTTDVFGEKVNETAIIMHYRGVAVTEDVKKALGDRFDLVRQPDVKPKWSDKAVAIWDVQHTL